MKALLLSLVTLFSATVLAGTENSQLEVRHQNLIQQEIAIQCELRRPVLTVVEHKVTPIRIDQGILDYRYETVFKVSNREDGGMPDLYEVKVVSSYHDMYDHEAQDWGAYSVDSVKCEML